MKEKTTKRQDIEDYRMTVIMNSNNNQIHVYLSLTAMYISYSKSNYNIPNQIIIFSHLRQIVDKRFYSRPMNLTNKEKISKKAKRMWERKKKGKEKEEKGEKKIKILPRQKKRNHAWKKFKKKEGNIENKLVTDIHRKKKKIK